MRGRRVLGAAWTALAAVVAGPVAAEPFAAAPAIADVALDRLRAGFDNGQGLRASFGIERSTSVNGVLVASQTLHIADLSRISAQQAGELRSLFGSAVVIGTGAGNAFALPAQSLPGATVIQNTLDGQTIRNLTVINATTNSLRALQGMNAAAALRDALVAPIAARP